MRALAASQPASSGGPGASTSMITGAWSEGIGLPLRASRSISAHTTRSAIGARHQQVVDAHAEVLVEVARAVVPPAVALAFGVQLPVGVDQPPGTQVGERLPLARRHVRAAVAPRRIPDVGVVGRDVEVAADDQRLAGLAGLGQPAPQAPEPGQLGFIEDRVQRAPVGRVDADDANAVAHGRDDARLAQRIVVGRADRVGRRGRRQRHAEVGDDVRQCVAAGDRDAVPASFAVMRELVAKPRQLVARRGDVGVGELRLLHQQDVGLRALEPPRHLGQARRQRVHVPGGDPHRGAKCIDGGCC